MLDGVQAAQARRDAVGAAAARWRDASLRLLRAARLDLAIVLALAIVAGALRLAELGSIPYGFHGDEAWTGIDARRVLDEGWIGVYVESALGQPTGPVYFTALIFGLLGESVYTVRLSMALIGIATIPAAYGAFALMFNRTTGVFAALILAPLTWHLHLSRLGFMVIAWPLLEMLVLIALWLALRRGGAWLYALAGFLLGLGTLTYNAYFLFVPLPFVALLCMSARSGAAERRRFAVMAAIFGAMALLGALPLLTYIVRHNASYTVHQEYVGVQYSEEWDDAGMLGKAEILWDRAGQLNRGLLMGAPDDCTTDWCFIADFGDGSGAPGHPLVGPVVYALALVGLGVSVWRVRSPEHALLVAAVLILPWGALLTTEWGMYRRTLGLAPFVAALAALPLAMLWEAAVELRASWAKAALAAAVIALPLGAGSVSAYRYFSTMQDTQVLRHVMAGELLDAIKYVDTLPEDTTVYFYSGRWSWDYESRRFLLPQRAGIDRSAEFGAQQPSDQLNLDAGPGRVAYVFIDEYVARFEDVRRRYPGGSAAGADRYGAPSFRAYYLDAEADRR